MSLCSLSGAQHAMYPRLRLSQALGISRRFSDTPSTPTNPNSAKPNSTKNKYKKYNKKPDDSKNQIPGGLLAVYKPKSWTSQDVCAKIKLLLHPYSGSTKFIKVGHGGTLDPMAEGVLVLGIRDGCKGMDAYLKGGKQYYATALLGSETDTLDAEGTVTETVPSEHITESMLDKTLEKFRGDIFQMPPMYSALKQNGTRLHALAREGIVVDRELRPATVYSLEMAEPRNKLPYFSLNVSCGGGFYIRSLITDLAKECGGAAHMTALVRTEQGGFNLDDVLYEDKWNFDDICIAINKHSEKAGFAVVPPRFVLVPPATSSIIDDAELIVSINKQ
jgi:tRNA pseudouridine55 synthase